MKIKLLVCVIVLISTISLTMTGCSRGPDSPKGFSLPQGDVVKGEAAFMKYQCLACHTIEGFNDDLVVKQFETPVRLGGTSSMITTYAQLVTSIINPSHKIASRAIGNDEAKNADGSSNMQVYNDVMTVSELTDIVAFLQPKYKVKPMQYTQYQNYYYIP
jgi:mono/diheme cytochrome c family protein